MRHAAALPAAIGASDFERPLSALGRKEAAQAARRLAAEGLRVDRILVSPARRTSETAQIVATKLLLDPEALVEVHALYAATPDAIRTAIAQGHGGADVLLVVGHNPGISEIGGELAGHPSHGHLPTSGFWRLSFDAGAWQALIGRGGSASR